jgi:hypothetical protein
MYMKSIFFWDMTPCSALNIEMYMFTNEFRSI